MPRKPMPIPGSELFRDKCCGCNEPMRVTYATLQQGGAYCLTCRNAGNEARRASMWDYLTPRQQIGKGKTQ